MSTVISKIYKDSIAYELGLEAGDKILKINNKEVRDIIDYRFLMCDEYVLIEVEKKSDGEIWELEIEKDYDEKLGVEFHEAIMDEAKSCRNNCIFCFIDQLPKGMRDSLYFKDDDSRLSFLQGNFITLTNLTDEDLDRIIKYKISPINVSVHTTDGKLRSKMLNNRFADNIMERLKKLADGGIKMNCQIVLCPKVNNGKELQKTVLDLYSFYPYVENIAGVPVGVTKFRDGLFDMEPYNEYTALEEINQIKNLQEKFMKEINSPFIRLSDEFYVMAKIDVPDMKFYGKFEQLEDGIGMIRIFRYNIENSLKMLNKYGKGSFTMVTGVSAYNEIETAAKLISEENENIKINTIKVLNKYFGETITVAGLLTGTDIIEALKTEKLGEFIIIPKNMLKADSEIFLDDITVSDIEKELDKKILVCDYTGEDLVQLINSNVREE